MMPRRVVPRLVLAGLVAITACKDSPPAPKTVGPPAQLVPIAGNNQSAPANTDVPLPIRLSVRDANGTVLGAGHIVTFSILEGGGSIVGSASDTSEADGTVTAPGWRLGKSNVRQRMQASLGSIAADIEATIATQYDIVVRYFGDPMSPTNQALFENAAARIEAIITGDVTNAQANSANLSQDCGPPGSPVPGLPTSLTEEVDDIIIYAAITAIDGTGSTLAQATPCVGRRAGSSGGLTMVAYGMMKFDAADFSGLASGGNIQEVITHEMLHVLGSGTLWETDRALITGKGGSDPRFLGNQTRQACLALGATVTCASSVPLENTGGTGTRDFHWRESAFNTELMTGFLNTGVNPLSSMTIASMADLNFVVNAAANDPYTFVGATQMSGLRSFPAGWEQIGPLRGMLLSNGRVERINLK